MNKSLQVILAITAGLSSPWLSAQNPPTPGNGSEPAEVDSATPQANRTTGPNPETPGDERPNTRPPARPDRPQNPGAAAAIQEQRRELQRALVASRAAMLSELAAANASGEEIQAALEAWRETHAEDFAALQELQRSLRDNVRGNRPGRPEHAGRPGPDDSLEERREEFAAKAAEIAAQRRALNAELRAAATGEERREILEKFRREQRDRLDEQKELRRARRRGGD